MFWNEVRKLNFPDKTRNDAHHLRKLIRSHISAKEWVILNISLFFLPIWFLFSFSSCFLQAIEAFSPFIMIILIADMIFLSCLVFQLDLVNPSSINIYKSNENNANALRIPFHQQMKHPDFGIVSVLVSMTLGLFNLFVYCYVGKMATESYTRMFDCLYECNWLDLSREHQKYFIIMIENTQRPLYYHGFGIAVLNLETFTKVSGIDFASNGQLIQWTIISFTDDSCGDLLLYDIEQLWITSWNFFWFIELYHPAVCWRYFFHSKCVLLNSRQNRISCVFSG